MDISKYQNEIPLKYKWDLSSLFVNEKEIEEQYEIVLRKIQQYTIYKGKVMSSSKNLLEVISFDLDIAEKIDRLIFYAERNYDVDMFNPNKKLAKEKAYNIQNQWLTESSFIKKEILKEPFSKIEQYEREIPSLQEYHYYLKRLYDKDRYRVTHNTETNILDFTSLRQHFITIASNLRNIEIDFGTIQLENQQYQLTNPYYNQLISSNDRAIRKQVFIQLHQAYSCFGNTFAESLRGLMECTYKISHLSGYKDVISFYLTDSEVDPAIYNKLIKITHKYLYVLHDYYHLKKEILKLDEIHVYDVCVPLIKEYNKSYSFDEAKQIVIEALSVLGKEYIKVVKKVFDERWIDVYSYPGKVSGAYGGGVYGANPCILINYQGKISDVKTLAHEVGHAVNAYLSFHNNSYQYAYYTTFVEEIPSTVNEFLLYDYLEKRAENLSEKLFIQSMKMEIFREKFYRQVMFAEFEMMLYQKIEKNEILTKDIMDQLYYDLNQLYYGEEFILDKEITYEWQRVMHFWEYILYVYQYAVSLAISVVLSERILKNNDFIDKYITFLKAGCHKNTTEILKDIDIELDDALFEKAIETFKKLIIDFKNMYNSNV